MLNIFSLPKTELSKVKTNTNYFNPKMLKMDTLFDLSSFREDFEKFSVIDRIRWWDKSTHDADTICGKFNALAQLQKSEHHFYFKNHAQISLQKIADAAHKSGLAPKIKTLHYDLGAVFANGGNKYFGELSNLIYKLPAAYFPNLKSLSLVSPQFKYSKLEIEQPLEYLYTIGLGTLEGINLSQIEVLHAPKNSIKDFSALKGAKNLQMLDASGSFAQNFDYLADLPNLKFVTLPHTAQYASEFTGTFKDAIKRGCKITYA
jgi:hypothetical protein